MAKRRDFKRLLVMADTHCGHNVGLTPPDWWCILPEGEGKRKKIAQNQRELWGWYAKQIDSKLRYCSSTGHFYRISNGKIAGGHRSSGGRVLSVGGVKCSEHILAWIVNYGQYPSEPIFHKNGDLSDNRISNLCTKSLMRFNFVMSILSKKD